MQDYHFNNLLAHQAAYNEFRRAGEALVSVRNKALVMRYKHFMKQLDREVKECEALARRERAEESQVTPANNEITTKKAAG